MQNKSFYFLLSIGLIDLIPIWALDSMLKVKE